MQKPISIGVDIGGTHITCAAVRIEEGLIIPETLSRATYSHQGTASVILQSWATALNNTISKVNEMDLAGIGCAIPGPFNYISGISKMQHKFKNLFNLHIPTALNPLLATKKVLPMRFLNDATAFAIGEVWHGEGQGFQKVVVITLGTGFGSAFIENGIPVVTGAQVPREGCLWHVPFKEGIADDYFSTRWFTESYHKQTGESIFGVKDLIEKANRDAAVRSLFITFGQNLSACLAAPLRQFEAEILVIGGNIAHALPLFEEALQEGLEKSKISVKIKISALMENGALIGSARLLDTEYWGKILTRLPNI